MARRLSARPARPACSCSCSAARSWSLGLARGPATPCVAASAPRPSLVVSRGPVGGCTAGPAGRSDGCAIGIRTLDVESRTPDRRCSGCWCAPSCSPPGVLAFGVGLLVVLALAAVRPDGPAARLARPGGAATRCSTSGRARGCRWPRRRGRDAPSRRRSAPGADRSASPGWAVAEPRAAAEGTDAARPPARRGAAGRAGPRAALARSAADPTWTRARPPSCVRSGSATASPPSWR